MSLNDFYYGMTCVLEHLLQSGSDLWTSYIQHMKYVSRQSMANAYVDNAFTGYDCMVVDKYLDDPRKGFHPGEVISVSSNFHAINFKREMSKVNFKKGEENAWEK